jgi:hypothetical protein
MSDSPGATRATIIHDITEDTNLQDLVANGSVGISDVRVGRASSKTTVTSAAGNPGTQTHAANGSCRYSVTDIAIQYPGAGIGSATVTYPSAISPSVSHQFMIGCALPAGSASRNALLDLLEG